MLSVAIALVLFVFIFSLSLYQIGPSLAESPSVFKVRSLSDTLSERQAFFYEQL